MESSIFLDYRCHPPSGGASATLVSAFSTTIPVLAVGTGQNQITFFLDEGVADSSAVVNCDAPPSQLSWQPKQKNVAVGLEDGRVELISYQAGSATTVSANTSIHSSKITFMIWSPSGSRLVTGDCSGICCVWKASVHGLSPSVQYKKGSALTCACFTTGSRGLTPAFFFGSESGTVSYADDLGHCTDVQSLSSCIDCLMFYEGKSRLVIVTRSLLMTQIQVNEDGRVAPVMKVKLSVAGDASSRGVREVCWAGPGLMAAACGEGMIRFWDLAKDENYVLTLTSAGLKRSERAISIAFNPLQRYIAVGTRDGCLCMWKFVGDYSADNKEKSKNQTAASDWIALPTVGVSGSVSNLTWGPGQGILAAGGDYGCVMLTETVLHRNLNEGVAAIQVNSDTVMIETDGGNKCNVNCGINVKGLVVDDHHLVVWNGKEAQCYGIENDGTSTTQKSDFPSSARSIALRKDTLFLATDNRLLITNLQGVQRMSVSFTEAEGLPMLLDLNGTFLAVTTDLGVIKLFDVSRKEPKPLGSSGTFVDPFSNVSLGVIRSISVNADGTRLAILSDRVHGGLKIREPDSRLHVYDSDRDIVDSYDFKSTERTPVSAFWDSKEPKLLSCETHLSSGVQGGGEGDKEAKEESKDDVAEPKNPTATRVDATSSVVPVEIITMFVDADNGIKLQDSFALEKPMELLVGINVPRLYFVSREMEDDDGAKSTGVIMPSLASTVMRDFVGLEDVDNTTKQALLDFSYNLTIGNMDEAYRAVKLIKNVGVWENMANMCVKTKRLDVAEVCLGNMGHARGAAAVREAKKEPEVEAAIAAVAIQLGLLDDAVRLYKECGRYDLLNKLYQGQGEWEKSIEIANNEDRIHLKTTHHRYAQYLESIGDTAGAIRNFERADTYKTEVPRMLFDQQRIDDLEDYIFQGNDTELLKWWAGYCESMGHFEKARRYYSRAGDDLSLVRVACHNREMTAAADIVNDTQSKSAAYHLARQLEAMGEVQEAISFFSQSGCYNHSIRLSKAYGLDSELMSFALKSRPSSMIDCAMYFEQKGEYEKAVQLYQKGGDQTKALSLCFRVGKEGKHGDAMFDVLQGLAEDLGGEDSGVAMSNADLDRCADFFIQNGQHSKAVELLYKKGQKFDYAIDLCNDHKVTITDEMAEGLTPPKSDDPVEQERRNETLKRLAKTLKKQSNFSLACKKYTQAGDRLKAMKCLLKSGDTKNIIFYAKQSRNKEIFILSANYLQSLDWHNDPDIMKNIITFYTKAKAFEQLASFYDACSQVEIDEYRDYEKALGALKEASKNIAKATTGDATTIAANLQTRIYVLEKFVNARRSMKTDPTTAESICLGLLNQPGTEVEESIRVGDCYALLIEYYHGTGNFQDAFDLMEQMRSRGIVLHPYLETPIMEDIYEGLGKPVPSNFDNVSGGGGGGGGGGSVVGSDDEIEDEIGEELDESINESLGSDDSFNRK
ncbi:hypothetical protein TrVE_jg6403 [Triparma verrucosa]|uniref:Intraflagellar transport protein 140 n=1 Tax=Triparma verrucosa TaxID=1606542 RepID=A0A9W7F9M3_9STRA|nr:hypothetical protein TrVE_jg6403 [Triparma verrucosa]